MYGLKVNDFAEWGMNLEMWLALCKCVLVCWHVLLLLEKIPRRREIASGRPAGGRGSAPRAPPIRGDARQGVLVEAPYKKPL